MKRADDDSVLADNLRLACRYYPSISAVCRRVGINRQQFNTYLSRGAMPSIANLRKLCDFFGVDESEIFLETSEFARVIAGRQRNNPYAALLGQRIPEIVGDPEDLRRQLRKYHGYYYCLFYSCGHPHHIIRSVAHIRESNGVCAVKTIEILADRSRRTPGYIFKRNGVMILNSSRLLILDYETAVNRTPSMTILFPTNRSRAALLSGVHVNVSGGSAQRPFAARVVYQNLGAAPNLREVIRGCGLFHEDSPEIPDSLKARIDNHIDDCDRVLAALE